MVLWPLPEISETEKKRRQLMGEESLKGFQGRPRTEIFIMQVRNRVEPSGSASIYEIGNGRENATERTEITSRATGNFCLVVPAAVRSGCPDDLDPGHFVGVRRPIEMQLRPRRVCLETRENARGLDMCDL